MIRASILLIAASVLLGDEGKPLCPVSGKAINKDVSVDYRGKKVSFCCEGCPDAFTSNKEKYAAKANMQLAACGEAAQVACPFSGKPVNPESKLEIKGVKVAFCCDNCKGKAEKASGDEQIAMIFGAKSKGFTLQTKCPVSGKKINPEACTEYKEKKVYFCCENCPTAFNKDPEKFASKLPKE